MPMNVKGLAKCHTRNGRATAGVVVKTLDERLPVTILVAPRMVPLHVRWSHPKPRGRWYCSKTCTELAPKK